MGLFFRYALTVQERHGIYALHASAIYKPHDDELLVIVGKAGAGKTVYLLEALARGYQIFSTEMTYFRPTPENVARPKQPFPLHPLKPICTCLRVGLYY
jgi:hypothetical protein